ncbi:MAG: DNA adenine methylase [Caloramator sp.]|nr:DNA adenine methylase [Caloramator sp.]
MKPLIKWPGGKAREFKYIEKIIPKFDVYIEPFFGGGAIFFELMPKCAKINDISFNLMQFYKYIKENNAKFKQAMYRYVDNWEAMNKYLDSIYPDLYSLYIKYRKEDLGDKVINEVAATVDDKANDVHEIYVNKNIQDILLKSKEYINKIFDANFLVDVEAFLNELEKNLYEKFKRTKQLEYKNGKLSDFDLKNNIESALRSGFYMHFRNIYNDIHLHRGISLYLTDEEKIANFYFIREFCYGSMFRYNSRGEFNIPYGGISYNSKNFRKKVDSIFDETTLNLFKQTDIYNKDFEEFLNSIEVDENCFMFVDPPYDTDFSDYEGRPFDKSDQERLAKLLCSTKAKFVLVIKNTDFIFDLYSNKENISILAFDKQYAYNVRSRNERNTEHLIITNLVI